jgi:hypothetical protein
MKFAKPEERVNAFVSSWFKAWSEAKERMGKDVDFDLWRSLILPVDEQHFASGCTSDSAGSFGTPAAHEPSVESVSNIDVNGDRALVETTLDRQHFKNWYEYDLVNVDGDWRLQKIYLHFKGADERIVKDSERSKVLSVARHDAPFAPLPKDVEPNGDRLFTPGREIERHGSSTTTELEHVGELDLASGMLAVRDFGYDVYDLPIIKRRVKPGKYPVEILRAWGRVAAVRVKFSSQPVVSWHPANDANDHHVIGVDAGNVAILDAAAFASMQARKRERLFTSVVSAPGGMKPATFVTLAKGNDCVVVESGWGDGGYPAYFGVDAKGQPAIFFVDFMMLGEENGEGYRN